MITIERLRELIKQGATIWYGRNRWGYPIKLDTKHFIIINGTLRYHKNKMLIGDGYESKDLREDVDCGKWEKQMFISRTERFEPPLWEDIGKDKNYKFKFMDNEDIIEFIVSKAPTMFYSNGYVFAYNAGTREVYISEPATKENYIKACEIVRDLFNKGGAK